MSFRASLIFGLCLCAGVPVASAQGSNMNIALSRLDTQNETFTDTNMNGRWDAGEPLMDFNGSGVYDPCATAAGAPGFCQDDLAWARVMTQFAGSMIPPVLTTASTRGVRGIYIGFESWLTGIDNEQDYWHRAVEGDGMDARTTHSRFVDSVLAWGRFQIRKGLPFGFELAASVSYLANTIYWAPGVEVKWSLFEGFRYDAGWIPDIAVRAAVLTLVGDGEFNVTIPSFDIILAEPFVIANTVEFIPFVYGQLAWVFVDSELVDLTPETTAFGGVDPAGVPFGCNPDPRTPDAMSGPPPYCRGDGSELNNNVVFPSIRSERYRLGAGLQIRYEWFTLLGSFAYDVVPPGGAAAADLPANRRYGGTVHTADLPADLPQQWQVSFGLGVTL